MLILFPGICFSSSPPSWLPPSPAWSHGEGISIRGMWTWGLEPFLALGPWSSYSATELQFFFFFLRTWHNLPLTAIGELSSLTRSHACCGGLAEVSHILGGGCVLFFSDLSSVLIIIPPESVISWLINKWTFPLRSLRTPSSLRDSGSRGRNGIGYTYTYHLGDTRKALTLPRPLPSNRPAGVDIGGRVGCVPLEKRDWW